MKIRRIINNQHGLTLIETLSAILVFILLSVVLITPVSNAIEKPKIAGVQNSLNTYEKEATLLLRDTPQTADTTLITEQLNSTLEKQLKFLNGKSVSKSPYKKEYNLEVKKNSTQTAIIINTVGKKDSNIFQIAIIKEGNVIESCSRGFGRKDTNLLTLVSDFCDLPEEEVVLQVPPGYIGIYNDVDLNNVRNNLTAKYFVMNDIDLTNSPFNTDADGWQPIGNSTTTFRGVFEGNNFTIKGMRINNTLISQSGLFGYTLNATMKDVKITDATINGTGSQGLFSGYGSASTFENISTKGTITSTSTASSYVGGIVGGFNNGTLKNSSADVVVTINGTSGYAGGGVGVSWSTPITALTIKSTVTGGSSTGGIVGYSSANPIKDSTSIITLSGNYVGGIVGNASASNISNSNSSGVITNSVRGGGIVGNSTNTILNSVTSSANVTGTNQSSGIVGYATTSTITNSSSTGTLVATTNVGGIIGRSSNSIVRTSNFQGTITGGSVAGGIVGYEMDGEVSNSTSSGNITGSTAGGVVGTIFDTEVFNLTSSGTVTGTSSSGKTGGVIGNTSSTVVCTPTNFTSTATVVGAGDAGGILGALSSSCISTDMHYTGSVSSTGTFSDVGGIVADLHGTLRNVSFNGTAQGVAYVGGIAGTSPTASTLENAQSHGIVKSTKDNVGGLIGSSAGVIKNSYSTANVEGAYAIGGLIGWGSAETKISSSYFTGKVKGTSSVGGIAGTLASTGSIKDSYSTGDITGTSMYVAGIVGNSNSSNVLRDNYSISKITTPSTSKGGVIGSSATVANITTNYYDTQKTGMSDIKGSPKTTSEMYQQSTYIGWDFSTIWKIEEGVGYPTHR